MSPSKKGISSNQLHRVQGIGLKAAWFMSYRICQAMRDGTLAPIGGSGVEEADETICGSKPIRSLRCSERGGPSPRAAILGLPVGNIRSFHVENADKATINSIVAENVARERYLYTHESHLYGDADATHCRTFHSQR